MNSERERLETFESWPANAEVEPQRIAKAGFFYTGEGMEVVCFSCGGRIREWNYGDQAMAKHRKLNPNCPFVKNPIHSGNIPIVNHESSLPYSIPSSSNMPSTSSTSMDEIIGRSLPDQSIRRPGNVRFTSSSSVEERNLHEMPSSSAVVASVQSTGEIRSTTFPLNAYKSEALRLQTFTSWPKGHIVTPEQLARTGFYFLHDGDKVQCAFCSGIIQDWKLGDDPQTEHRRHFPSCPLHCNVPEGNIPLDSGNTSVNDSSQNRCENALQEVRPFSGPEKEHGGFVGNRADMRGTGIHTHRGPTHPKYSTVESRLRTFTNWPSNLSQTPQQLAQAGFYYTGVNDQVRCFHCDGGLRQWDTQDDPWVEHARWFSKCTFVVLVKGEEFINRCIAEYPPLIPTNDQQSSRMEPTAEQPTFRLREVTEEELQGLMNMELVRVALGIGLDPVKIKQALRLKIEQTGLPFSTSDALIDVVLDISSDTNTPESSAQDNVQTAPSEPMDESAVRPTSAQGSEPTISGQHVPLSLSKSMPVLSEEEVGAKLEVDAAQSMPHIPEGLRKNLSKAGDNSLEEENRRLKEARLCKICMDEEVGVVFVPCGHLITCVTCTPSIKDCPLCRQPIKATVRTFLS